MSRFTVLLGLLLPLIAAASCGDDESPPPQGPGDAGSGGNEPDCFEDPKTHFEIINACTDSVKVEKTPRLELLNPDGSLPPP